MASFASDIVTPTATDGAKPTTARAGDVAAAPVLDDASRPAVDRPANVAPELATADAGKPVLDRAADRMAPPTTTNAVLVPGDFRGVAVQVVDKQGNPLPEVEKLLVLDPFPSATKIDEDAVGELPMLSASYTDFRGLAPRDDDVGYLWYEGVQNVVGPQDDAATIVLDPQEIKGLYAGPGASFGGSQI